jgi:hypothetical protein
MTGYVTEYILVAKKPDSTADSRALFCDRCSTELHPGAGNFYRVTIEAVADPAPPPIREEDLAADLGQQIADLISQLQDTSAQEAMDQVYRRLTLYLCGPCYRRWIENPTDTSRDR